MTGRNIHRAKLFNSNFLLFHFSEMGSDKNSPTVLHSTDPPRRSSIIASYIPIMENTGCSSKHSKAHGAASAIISLHEYISSWLFFTSKGLSRYSANTHHGNTLVGIPDSRCYLISFAVLH